MRKRPFTLSAGTTIAILQLLGACIFWLWTQGGNQATDKAALEEVRKHGTELARAEAQTNSRRYEELIQRISKLETAVSALPRIEDRLDALMMQRRARVEGSAE
ncbi:MAG TPA: hypothetical protein VFO36_03375 [Nitrospiraceae bacterium]|nr:hypothetical protein [Nitrospiraceae bacterium]